MESLSELYRGCRSYRRFQQKEVPPEILQELAETARTRSSGVNAQPLRYIVVSKKEIVDRIQPYLHWAAKLPKEIGTPKEGERPTAFILVLGPEQRNSLADIDMGIALDTMAITAWQHGVGSCILGSFDRKELLTFISVPEGFTIRTILALGYPAHSSTIVDPDEAHGLAYYVDEERNYYVPKRKAEDVIRYI